MIIGVFLSLRMGLTIFVIKTTILDYIYESTSGKT